MCISGSRRTAREVVDGQQRLRTLFSYIDPGLMADYKPSQDAFDVRPIHNKELAGLRFDQLSEHHRNRILGYEFSTHVLPEGSEDRDVLEVFARLNATGEKLNHQELRNAEYFGEMKTLMYELSREQLERWTKWKIFNDDQIARMREVELTSDLAINIIQGTTGKSQPRINEFYAKYDGKFSGREEFRRRFRLTIDNISKLMDEDISNTVYRSEVYFFTLFVFIYDCLYGLGSKLTTRQKPRTIKRGMKGALLKVGHKFQEQKVPHEVLDSVVRASADLGRRQTRLKYLTKEPLAK